MAVYLVCYIISFILARQHFYMLSGLVLITAALWLYIKDYRETGNLIHLRGLFCLFFVGGQGISCFKLSRLQTDWDLRTWVCLGLAVLTFWIVFEVLHRIYDGWSAADMQSVYRFYASAESPLQAKRLLHSMAALVVISFLAFFFEAWKLGFVPLFSYGVPHAYSYFHVSGVHYFTVSCVLVPSLFVVYSLMISRRGRGLTRDQGFWLGLLMVVLSLAVPVLCVSRFQLILAVGMAAFTYISMSGTFSLVYVGVLMACMIPAYLLLTVMRSHSVEYLNGIFEMKNSHMPIFITQPYMYIANNYDNFNCLVEQLPSFAMGLRMLFPLWAFTGLKFLAPGLVNFPLYVTKEELTTVTILYDSYYDFGVFGVILFALLLGLFCRLLSGLREWSGNPVVHVIYAQIAMYMALAFFTTWFSNPSTWFYLGATVIAAVFVGWKRK